MVSSIDITIGGSKASSSSPSISDISEDEDEISSNNNTHHAQSHDIEEKKVSIFSFVLKPDSLIIIMTASDNS